MDNRREFLRKAGAAAVGTAIAPGLLHGQGAGGATPGDGPGKDLLMTALQAARDAGASYADARLGRYRRQAVRHTRAPADRRHRHRVVRDRRPRARQRVMGIRGDERPDEAVRAGRGA